MAESAGARSGNDPHPLVSVVMPTYRRPAYLSRAIESVLCQSMRSWELIVVDDNGADAPEAEETRKLVESYGHDPRLRYVRHESNRGGSAARNTGIRSARADLVAFLDDDDEWDASKLHVQVAVLARAGASTALAYCKVRRVEVETGEVRVDRPHESGHSLRTLLKRNGIGTTSAILCRRSALMAVGMFDEELPARQDVDLYVRLATRFDFTFVDQPLVTWYRHDDPSIGRDLDAMIRAHRAFHAKHRMLIKHFPDVEHELLVSVGRLLTAAGRRHEAQAAFLRAWRIRPWSWKAPIFLAMNWPLAWPLIALGRRVRDRLKRIRPGPQKAP